MNRTFSLYIFLPSQFSPDPHEMLVLVCCPNLYTFVAIYTSFVKTFCDPNPHCVTCLIEGKMLLTKCLPATSLTNRLKVLLLMVIDTLFLNSCDVWILAELEHGVLAPAEQLQGRQGCSVFLGV
jgi:hypothetical protein